MQPSNRGPLRKEEGRGKYEGEMKAVVHAYAEVMKLIRHLPPRTRSYYSQFARENFVTYSQEQDPSVIRSLLLRAHHHSCWVLRKYGMDEAVADKLRRICAEEPIQSNI